MKKKLLIAALLTIPFATKPQSLRDVVEGRARVVTSDDRIRHPQSGNTT